MTIGFLPRALLLVSVLALIVRRPRGMHVALPATAGAITAALVGWLNRADLINVFGMTWNATATLTGLMLISAVLERNGAFAFAARQVALRSGGSGWRLFVGLCVLTTLTTAILANDGAILLVTPMLLELGRLLAWPPATTFSLLFATGFLVDALSTPLVSSNLTNILLANGLHISGAAFVRRMALPTLLMLPVAIGTLAIVLRRSLPRAIDRASLMATPPHAFRTSSRVTTVLALTVFVGACVLADWQNVPIGPLVLGIGALLWIAESVSKIVQPWPILRELPWGIVIFAQALFLVVIAVAKGGASQWLADQLVAGPIRSGFVVAALAAVFNNLAVLVLSLIALRDLHHYAAATPFAVLIGSNVGSKLLPMGSLATLLWLEMIGRAGIHVRWRRYITLAFLPTLATLIVGLLALR